MMLCERHGVRMCLGVSSLCECLSGMLRVLLCISVCISAIGSFGIDFMSFCLRLNCKNGLTCSALRFIFGYHILFRACLFVLL